MPKLLKFEFRRAIKSIFFWIVTGFCVIWPILVAVFYRVLATLDFDTLTFHEIDMSRSEIMYLTWMIGIAFVNELPKFIALFAVLHIGREYTDGIVRNKIIAGHSRGSIYFSYLIVQICATIFWCIVYVFSALFGMVISGFGANVNNGEMFIRFGVGIVVTLVMTVFFSVLSVIFRRRGLPIVLSIIVVMVFTTAATVIGNYNQSLKSCNDYLDARHDSYEMMVDIGMLTDDDVEELEEEHDRNEFLGIGWKIFHPAYVVSPIGFGSDYKTGTVEMLLGEPEYSDEIDFSYFYISKSMMSGDMSAVTTKDLKKVDSMHVTYSTLNLVYTGKSLLWIAFFGGWGYYVFRKKNLF